jgi:hypothetical protein
VARLNYLAILYLELFRTFLRYPEQKTRENETPSQVGDRKNPENVPDQNKTTHFTSGIHSFKPISITFQYPSEDTSSRVLHGGLLAMDTAACVNPIRHAY